MAKPDEIKKAVDYLRFQIAELYGQKAAQKVRVLYGGSVDEHDVRSYLEIDGVDGALVGAASLNYQQFARIVEIAQQVQTKV